MQIGIKNIYSEANKYQYFAFHLVAATTLKDKECKKIGSRKKIEKDAE
jgi:hypothetical protein